MKENYEVILEHEGYTQILSSFRTKKLAQQYMEDNYYIIEDWWENRIEFNKFYIPSTREITYETSDLSTILRVRKLTK